MIRSRIISNLRSRFCHALSRGILHPPSLTIAYVLVSSCLSTRSIKNAEETATSRVNQNIFQAESCKQRDEKAQFSENPIARKLANKKTPNHLGNTKVLHGARRRDKSGCCKYKRSRPKYLHSKMHRTLSTTPTRHHRSSQERTLGVAHNNNIIKSTGITSTAHKFKTDRSH